jgi:hypothetical protein
MRAEPGGNVGLKLLVSQVNKQEQRVARKRAETIQIEGAGYTSRKRAEKLVESGRARINEHGKLVFLNPNSAPTDPVRGINFEWFKGYSGGCAIMMTNAGRR